MNITGIGTVLQQQQTQATAAKNAGKDAAATSFQDLLNNAMGIGSSKPSATSSSN